MTKRTRGICVEAAVCLLASVLSATADETWRVEKASLRFDVRVVQPPSDPAAGVVAILPDGGLLPPPAADPVVVTPEGQPVRSEVVWHNPSVGLAVVFEVPASAKGVHIYVQGGIGVAPGRGPSGLRPSLLLFTRRVTLPSLELAQEMAASPSAGSEATMGLVPHIAQMENPFGGDDNYVSCYSGWLKTEKLQRIYFCTVSDEGSEMRLDGQAVASWAGEHTRAEGAKGQYGTWQEVHPGLHLVEYFHFEKIGPQEAHALWRIPGVTPGELPVTIPESAFLHSGIGRITRAAFRDGRPVAAVSRNTQAISYLWFGEAPVNLFRLAPDLYAGNSSDTTYTWIVEPAGRIQSRELTWLFAGDGVPSVTLLAANSRGSSGARVPVEPWTPPRASGVDNAAEREAYRAALLEMCKAVPPEQDPCAGWSADLWAVLINVSEPFRGVLLLRQVFERAPGEIRSLRTADRQYLEEILAGGLRILEPAAVPRWLDRFEQDESEATARFRWKLERFDYTLYDLNDAASARSQAAELASAAKTPEEKALAQIRAGDVERAAGNLPAAKAAYSAAQDWYRDRIRAISSGQGAIPPPSRSTRRERPRRRQTEPSPAPSPTPPQNWKTFALHEASFLVTVRHLIAGGFLFEARDALGRWELEYPLCKVSGDYPLAEAEYHMAAQHYRRALAGLRIYRAGVEISSSLPEAMQLELECLSRLKEKDEAQKLAREILRQFPNHPVANKAREVLAGGV